MLKGKPFSSGVLSRDQLLKHLLKMSDGRSLFFRDIDLWSFPLYIIISLHIIHLYMYLAMAVCLTTLIPLLVCLSS